MKELKRILPAHQAAAAEGKPCLVDGGNPLPQDNSQERQLVADSPVLSVPYSPGDRNIPVGKELLINVFPLKCLTIALSLEFHEFCNLCRTT